MSITEALLRGLMLFLFVFLVLALLCVVIGVFSRIIGAIDKAGKKTAAQTATAAPAAADVSEESDGPWGGKLKLKDVDEQTAAMIMAIVSDESGIPLSELVFKSISLVDSKQDAKEEA